MTLLVFPFVMELIVVVLFAIVGLPFWLFGKFLEVVDEDEV